MTSFLFAGLSSAIGLSVSPGPAHEMLRKRVGHCDNQTNHSHISSFPCWEPWSLFPFSRRYLFFRGAFGRKINMHKQGRVMERQCYLHQWLCMKSHFYTVLMHNTRPSVIVLMKRSWAGIPFEKKSFIKFSTYRGTYLPSSSDWVSLVNWKCTGLGANCHEIIIILCKPLNLFMPQLPHL